MLILDVGNSFCRRVVCVSGGYIYASEKEMELQEEKSDEIKEFLNTYQGIAGVDFIKGNADWKSVF